MEEITPVVEKENSLGQYLRKQREMRQISHNEIARVTKINVGILKSLEEDDYSRLPAPPFVRGFLSSIGKYLGLDTHELLLRYEQILSGQPYREKTLPTMGRPATQVPVSPLQAPREVTASFPQQQNVQLENRWDKWVNKKTLPVYITVLFVVVVLGFLKSVGQKKTETPSQISTSDNQATGAEKAALPTPPVPATADLENATSTSVIPTPVPVTAKTETPTPAPTPVAATTPPPLATPPVAPATPVAGEQHVAITAKVDTFFKVQMANQGIQNITLRAGETTEFHSKEKVTLLILNAGSISITHNGKRMGRPGPWGKDMKLEFPTGL